MSVVYLQIGEREYKLYETDIGALQERKLELLMHWVDYGVYDDTLCCVLQDEFENLYFIRATAENVKTLQEVTDGNIATLFTWAEYEDK